jgi:hypothetical protein
MVGHVEEDSGLETLLGLVRVSVLANISSGEALNAGVESRGNFLGWIAARNKAVEESLDVGLDSSSVACKSKDAKDHTSNKPREYARGVGGSRGQIEVKVESLFEEAVCKAAIFDADGKVEEIAVVLGGFEIPTEEAACVHFSLHQVVVGGALVGAVKIPEKDDVVNIASVK